MGWIESISEKRKWIFNEGETGRLYTHVCFLKRELRQFLRFEGYTQLVKLDVKNCIPFLTIAFFEEQLFKSLNLHHKIQCINPSFVISYNNNLLMLVEILKNPGLFEDVKLYISEVVSGYLYDNIKDTINIAYNSDYSRSFAKRKILNVFNRPPDLEC